MGRDRAGSHMFQTIPGVKVIDDSGDSGIGRAELAQYGAAAHAVDGVATCGGPDTYCKSGRFSKYSSAYTIPIPQHHRALSYFLIMASSFQGNQMRRTMLIVSLATIAGCASTPLRQEGESVEHGEFPNNFSEIVKSHYRTIVKEPESIRFNVIHAPMAFLMSDGFPQAKYGYLVCADLNFKDSSGKYTGHHTDGLFIYNGHIIQFMERGQWLGKSVC